MKQHTHALAGQLYADALVDNAKARAARVMASYVRAVRGAISGAKTYPEMRRRLRRVHADTDPKLLRRLLERALVMGELAGRRALKHEHT